jgi:hypothetical protein
MLATIERFVSQNPDWNNLVTSGTTFKICSFHVAGMSLAKMFVKPFREVIITFLRMA